jgi:hypothetical protein
MGQTALHPRRRKACWGFFRPKNPTAAAGFDTRFWVPGGSMLTTRPPKVPEGSMLTTRPPKPLSLGYEVSGLTLTENLVYDEFSRKDIQIWQVAPVFECTVSEVVAESVLLKLHCHLFTCAYFTQLTKYCTKRLVWIVNRCDVYGGFVSGNVNFNIWNILCAECVYFSCSVQITHVFRVLLSGAISFWRQYQHSNYIHKCWSFQLLIDCEEQLMS